MGWAADPMRKSESIFTAGIIQMGARVYLPSAGRFLQVDPVAGGTPNAYVYAGDPINSTDYTGMAVWSKVVNFVKKVAHVVTSFVKKAVEVVKTVVKAAVAIASDIVNNYVKPAAAKIGSAISTAAGAVATAAKNTFQFVGKHSGKISTGIAVIGLAACTVASVGLCGGAAAVIFAAASATVSYIGARYEGHSQGASLLRGASEVVISKIPFGGKNLQAVRWFGDGRQYRSIKTALMGGRGLINNRAAGRLLGQFSVFSGGIVTGAFVDNAIDAWSVH